MGDVLAVLDAAIDGLAVTSSRYSRRQASAGTAASASKYLNSAGLPGLPVLPAPKRKICGSPAQTQRKHSERSDVRANEYIRLTTGSTGSTGSIEEFCGSPRSRAVSRSREVSGGAGTIVRLLATVDGQCLDQLDPTYPPGDVPQRRWAQFIDDARAFLASGFSGQAQVLGWTNTDLFGCDDERPYARIDCMGLVWLLNGDRLVALTADAAVIERESGARLLFRRRGRQSMPMGMRPPSGEPGQPASQML